MNYYIQGNKDKADKIKAAFEKKGCVMHTGIQCDLSDMIYFSLNGKVGGIKLRNLDLFKAHPDYQELELPKPHYDIANFKPYDKVLGRNCCRSGVWRADLFSHIHKNGKLFVGIGYTWGQCIPFNDDTKHLLGTTEPCGEEYINW